MLKIGSGSITFKNAVEASMLVIDETGRCLIFGSSMEDNLRPGDNTLGRIGYGSTVEAGAGNDVISVEGSFFSSLVGGAGNDTIRDDIGGSYHGVTINGGLGDDYIINGDVFEYANGDGNDSITNFQSGDIIRLTSGSLDGISLNNEDIIVKVGAGSITLNISPRKENS